MDVPERFEQLIAFLGSQLPGPVDQQGDADGSLQFIGGEPPEVVALLTHSSVVVSEFAGVWETPFKFAARPRRVGVLKWRRLPENALLTALSALIKGARDARLSRRSESAEYCDRRTAPGVAARRTASARRAPTVTAARCINQSAGLDAAGVQSCLDNLEQRDSRSFHLAYAAVTSRWIDSTRASTAAIASAPSL